MSDGTNNHSKRGRTHQHTAILTVHMNCCARDVHTSLESSSSNSQCYGLKINNIKLRQVSAKCTNILKVLPVLGKTFPKWESKSSTEQFFPSAAADVIKHAVNGCGLCSSLMSRSWMFAPHDTSQLSALNLWPSSHT